MPALHVLCGGTPSPSPELFGTSCAMELGDELIMVDCGPAATWKLFTAGFTPLDVDWLFFTHHHSDHNADYPCLQLVRWDHCTGTQAPLRVVGPPPTEEMTHKLFGADGVFADDIAARIGHVASHRCHLERGGSLPRPAPEFDVHDVAPGDVVEAGAWTARCSSAEHVEPWLTSLAWRFDWDGGSVGFTGDTQTCAPVTELVAGVDTLVANCPLQQEKIHSEMRTCIWGTLDAAAAARDAGARRLVLIHLTGSLVAARDAAVAEMAEIYDGEIIFGLEGTVVEL